MTQAQVANAEPGPPFRGYFPGALVDRNEALKPIFHRVSASFPVQGLIHLKVGDVDFCDHERETLMRYG